MNEIVLLFPGHSNFQHCLEMELVLYLQMKMIFTEIVC